MCRVARPRRDGSSPPPGTRRPRAWTVALALALAVAPAGCADDPAGARIDVVVREGAVGVPDLDELELRVSVPSVAGDEQVRLTTTPARYDEAGRLFAWTVPTTPAAGSDVGRVVYRFRASGRRGEQLSVSAQARVVFVAGTRLVLPLSLEGDCVGVACADDETCVAGGRCVDDFVPACLLAGADAAAGCPADAAPEDLGASDLGLDAGAPGEDAGRPDAEPPLADAADVGPDLGPPTDLDAAGPECRTAADCDDGLRCTDDGCVDGACVHPPPACDDGDPCTVGESCDEASGGCVSAPLECGTHAACAAGVCRCDGGFEDCDGLLGCESDTSRDPAHCGACAIACAAPTPACLGGRCAACASAADCPPDALSCTAPPSCVSGACVETLTAGSCLIDGVCRADLATNPANQCERCEAATAPTRWTARSGACDDGLACTLMDRCTAGACAGTPRDCDDALDCTTDTCAEPTGRCVHAIGRFACLIDGACYLRFDHRPINGACWICDPTRSQTSWSPLAGATCASGAGICTAAGGCCAPPDAGPMICFD